MNPGLWLSFLDSDVKNFFISFFIEENKPREKTLELLSTEAADNLRETIFKYLKKSSEDNFFVHTFPEDIDQADLDFSERAMQGVLNIINYCSPDIDFVFKKLGQYFVWINLRYLINRARKYVPLEEGTEGANLFFVTFPKEESLKNLVPS